MLKICVLTSTLDYGGATKILIELSNHLSKKNYVSVLTYGESKDSFYNLNDEIIIEKLTYNNKQSKYAIIFQLMRTTRKSVKKLDPDLIIAFGNTEKLLAIYSSLLTKTKVLISERQDPYNYSPGHKHHMWVRYILADGCVFQTEGAALYFPKIVRNKSTIIPNFLMMEERPVLPMEAKEHVISYSARFELRQKRQDVMINAFELLHIKYPDWRLVFYGDGADLPLVKQMVNSKGLEDYITFAGKCSNVLDRLYQSSIFVLTSDYEGIPNALLEAMGLGLPCVSTDCSPGGASLLISNTYNGLLVPCDNHIALAGALESLIENPTFANTLGKSAQSVLDIYSPDSIFKLWDSFIIGMFEGDYHCGN